MLSVEAEIVSKRIDRMEAHRAALLQMAVSSILSKKSRAAFEKTIKKMTSADD